jgi:hypothetical protein
LALFAPAPASFPSSLEARKAIFTAGLNAGAWQYDFDMFENKAATIERHSDAKGCASGNACPLLRDGYILTANRM